jgi:hypothetical protein
MSPSLDNPPLSSSSPSPSSGGNLDDCSPEKLDDCSAEQSMLDTSGRGTKEEYIRVDIESTVGALQGKGKRAIWVLPSDRVERILEKFLEPFPGEISAKNFILRDVDGLIVDSNKSVFGAGIQDTIPIPILYLSTRESEKALFSYANWWKVAGLCLILSLGILGGSLGAYFAGYGVPYVYGVVVDAGSVHTSVYTYRFAGDKLNGTGVLEEAAYCDMGEVGISSFIDNPAGVQTLVNSSCLREAVAKVYTGANVLPLYLGGTAGMRTLRLVDRLGAGWIMGNLTAALNRLVGQPTRADIVSGQMEGLTGWICTNYLEGKLGDFNVDPSLFHARSSRTLAALDWGGASAQITSEVSPVDATHNITLYGRTYHLRTLSHLCYGQKEALYRHRTALFHDEYTKNRSVRSMLKSKPQNVKSNTTKQVRIEDPCAPLGSSVTHTLEELFDSPCTQWKDSNLMKTVVGSEFKVIYSGQGDAGRCREQVEQLFQHKLCLDRYKQYSDELVCMGDVSPSPPQQEFFAFSTYWYLMQTLNLPQHHSLDRFDSASSDLCSRPRNASLKMGLDDSIVDSACFKSVFMRALLTLGYSFNKTNYEQIKFVKRAGSAEVGWTLGHSIMASNAFKEEPYKYGLKDYVFVACLTLFMVAFFLTIFFVYKGWIVTRAYRGYQRFGSPPPLPPLPQLRPLV